MDKYKALSNDHVWRLLRSAPTAVELSVQRLQWWQRIVARPEEHLALLFTFFGHIPGTPAPFDENGAIHDRSHAWMRQLGEDIRQLDTWDSSGFMVQAPDVRTLDKELLKFGRKVLQGTACEKSVDKYKALSNDHVWRLLRSAPTAVELSVQRLQWWQRIVARPEEHLALLFTFFGHIPGTPAPFDENGAIHDRSHAWMRQLGEDIRQLATWDSSGFMSAAADGPLVLFVDADFREAFLQQDPAELRTRYLGGLVPPPGLSLPSAAPPGADAADETFACDALLADGQPCNATFPTYRALAVHLAHSKQHEQRRSLATLLTISNQCCACRATLASVRVARNHLHDSIRRGYCSRTAGSATVHQVHASLPCKCAICDVPLRLLGEAQAHLASHLPTAFRRPRIDYYFQRHGRPVGSAPSASA